MSIRIMSLVWDNFPRGGSDKLAMLALADWCNDLGGSLYPSIAAIAKKINTSECQARRIVHSLIDEGYLTVIGNHAGGKPGQARQYQMILSKLATAGADATPSVDATPSTHAHRGLAPMHERASAGESLTPKEPPKEPPKTPKGEKKPRNVEQLPVPEWLDLEAWDMWLRHRKTLSPDAHNVSIRSLTKLRNQGHDPVEVIEQSVMAGWTGLFELKKTQARAPYESEKDRSRREFAQAIFGKGKNEQQPNERDITSFAERLD